MPLVEEPGQDVMLLRDSGFEDGNAKAWRFSDWPPRPKTRDRPSPQSIFYSQDVVHSGKWSVCLDHTTVGPDRILGVRQLLSREALAPYDGRRVRLSAWMWVARGPEVYTGAFGMRQWGQRGAPPFGGARLRLTGRRGEWSQCSREFTLHLGDTQRADVNVWLRATPGQDDSPVCYVDDVRLEVLAERALGVDLLSGQTLTLPDTALPLRVTVAAEAWGQGMRCLRWDVTAPDGRHSHRSGRLRLAGPVSVVEALAPGLPEGRYAVRAALGGTDDERRHEVLLPFRLAAGPFAR